MEECVRTNHYDFERYRTRAASRYPSPEVIELFHGAATLVRCWVRRARERIELARLDHRMLRDIGVTPNEAERECNKPFWRV
jgi:uncharacterized protein YjiS (DUF1127 family)